MTALQKLTTLELERELLMRAIERQGANIRRLETELGNARLKQCRRMDEITRLSHLINFDRAAATVAKKKPAVKATPKPLRKRAVKGGAS